VTCFFTNLFGGKRFMRGTLTAKMLLSQFDLQLFVTDPVSQFPEAIANELQQGYLERAYQPGLEPNEVYNLACERLNVPAHTGDTITRTKPGLLTANEDPVDPSLAVGLSNGMTNEQYNNEQYTVTMELFNGTQAIDIKTMPMGIVNRWRHVVKASAKQARQSVDRYRRNQLMGGLCISKGTFNQVNGYLGGTTIATAATTSSTTVHVDDVSGFTFVLVNGDQVPVSGSNPLQILSGGVVIGEVTGVALDSTNSMVNVKTYATTSEAAGYAGSSMRYLRGTNAANIGTPTVPNGQNLAGRGASGTLTLAAAYSFTAGQVIQSAFAPQIVYPNGKDHFSQLASSDLFSEACILDMVAYLRDAQIPTIIDDMYACVLDNTTWRQLYADQDFQTAFETRGGDPVYSRARLASHLGVAFFMSTNAPYTPKNGGLAVPVRWPVVFGQGALVDGISDINGIFANIDEQEKRFAYVTESDGICAAVRPPIDNQGRFVQMSWETIRGAVVPTDLTANGIVESAGDGYAKRAVFCPVAG
jgi:hypothetical protein